MLSRTRRFAGVAVAALALSAGIPAATAGADSIELCRAVVSHSTGSEIAILLEGRYTHSGDGNAEARLTCHIVQNGVKVVSITDPLEGPHAALASDERIDPDPFYVCHELTVWKILGPQPIDYPQDTNC